MIGLDCGFYHVSSLEKFAANPPPQDEDTPRFASPRTGIKRAHPSRFSLMNYEDVSSKHLPEEPR